MNELMQQGLQLMALGMGSVFLFLGLLIGVINVVSRIIQKYETVAPEAEHPSTSSNQDLIEVISEAVKSYRSDHPHRKA